MKKLLAFVLTLVLAAGLSACGSPKETASSGDGAKTVIRVGSNILPNPPYSFSDDDGKQGGYTVEYLKAVEKKLGDIEFQLDLVDAQAMLLGVDSGKYGFAANYYFKNPEREQKYLFAGTPYGYSVTGLIVKSERNDINSLEDVSGKTLVPETPNSGLYYIIKDYNIKHPDKQIKNETIDQITDADALKQVASGQYDVDFINIHNYERIKKELDLDLKVATVVSKEPIWILFNQSQGDLKDRFEKATQELIADGTLPALSEKWFGFNFFESIEELKKGYKFRE